MCITSKFSLVCFTVLTLVACGGGGGGGGSDSSSNSTNTAEPDSTGGGSSTNTGSHNAGSDCRTSGCHDENGASAFFRVAGTVYKSGGGAHANATVRLFVRDTNTLLAELKTDDSGNFFSTRAVDGLSENGQFTSGVDVSVEGRSMRGIVTEGSCNFCHGDSVGNISVN
jgi:hypothetical protein